jgi:hypothetical protein
MTGPSSAPRGEHAPRPGVTWDTEVVGHGEQYVPECAASIRDTCLAELQGDTACDTEAGECIHAMPMPTMPPRPDRTTRRAIARAARREPR